MTYLKLLATAFLWGGTFIAGRALAGHVTPPSAAFLRFAVATACLHLLAWRIDGGLPKLRPGQAFGVAMAGLTGVFSYNLFFFSGLTHVTASRASLIIATNPVFIALASAALFGDRLSRTRLTGILLSATGAMVVISKGRVDLLMADGAGLGIGEAMIFGSVASWVAFSLIGKRVLAELSPLASITYAATAGTAALLIPALMDGMLVHLADYRMADWFSIGYLGIFGTTVGFIWYYQGIRSIGPSRAGLFINFVPVSAILLGILILHEPVTASLFVGAALVTTGAFLTNRPAPQAAARTEVSSA
ncbi:MAG: DMT family transporter [Desulfococcaceae bacterium]